MIFEELKTYSTLDSTRNSTMEMDYDMGQMATRNLEI